MLINEYDRRFPGASHEVYQDIREDVLSLMQNILDAGVVKSHYDAGGFIIQCLIFPDQETEDYDPNAIDWQNLEKTVVRNSFRDDIVKLKTLVKQYFPEEFTESQTYPNAATEIIAETIKVLLADDPQSHFKNVLPQPLPIVPNSRKRFRTSAERIIAKN